MAYKPARIQNKLEFIFFFFFGGGGSKISNNVLTPPHTLQRWLGPPPLFFTKYLFFKEFLEEEKYSQTFYDTSYWYYKFCRGVGGLILVVGIREKQIICLSESFLNSFLLVSSENTPPLNIFVMFKRTPLRFFKDVLKCPLLEKVLFLAKRVVGNLFFNLILCFPNKKTEF